MNQKGLCAQLKKNEGLSKELCVLKEIFDEGILNILNLFFKNPKKRFNLTDISKEVKLNIVTTQRKLKDLMSLDIIKAHKKKEKSKNIHSYQLGKGEKPLMLSEIFI